jgi:GntR family transcriptional regulator / MocR family aminotransferase
LAQNEGHLERHIRQMRQLYDRRRQTLVRSLKNYLGERVKILGDNAGIHLMAKIDSHFQDEEII